MTKEKTKERIKVMQAYVDGKDIEAWDKVKQTWELVIEPSWANFGKYRIKPESSYRPFASAQECIEELKKHEPFGWTKDKPEFGNTCSVIMKVSSSGFIKRDKTWDSLKEMFQYITFFDGTPFGIKVEDDEEK